MIEGLKPTVSGEKLKDLCIARASYHTQRAEKYQEQVDSMERAEIEGMNYTNGDPKRALKDKQNQHLADAEEMLFLAQNINVYETYILDSGDLQKLGICRNRY